VSSSISLPRSSKSAAAAAASRSKMASSSSEFSWSWRPSPRRTLLRRNGPGLSHVEVGFVIFEKSSRGDLRQAIWLIWAKVGHVRVRNMLANRWCRLVWDSHDRRYVRVGAIPAWRVAFTCLNMANYGVLVGRETIALTPIERYATTTPHIDTPKKYKKPKSGSDKKQKNTGSKRHRLP